MDRLWRRYSEPDVLIERFGECSAFFCAATGETHILDAFPSEVLSRLSPDEPVSSRSISAAIATFVDEPASDWQGKVEEMLRSLERMRLVESVPA